MPSGREKGPEKRSNTRRDVLMAEARVLGARWRCTGMAGAVVQREGGGSPCGCSPSASQGLAMA
eukprot:6174940-Pleurochrysis_carterae.AAC.2